MIQHVLTNIFQYKLASFCRCCSAKYRVKRKKPKRPFAFPRTSKPHLYILLLLLLLDVTSYLNSQSHPFIFLPTASAMPSSSAPFVHHHLPYLADLPDIQLMTPSAFTSASASASASSSSSTTNSQCPVVCSCIWKSGKQTATCDRRNLVSVPIGLAPTTQVIDLTGNSLNVLPPNVFMDRGLINLQRIFLVDCGLREISSESFVKLSNLIELDLSNNSLISVPSKSFAEAAALRRLSLSGNRIREIRSAAFLSLARLNVLDLSANSIAHLDTDAFRGLRSLQTLKLEGNQLATLPAAESFVQFLPVKMASLGLHDNRWRCDCHLKAVREWITANNVPLSVKPICSAPARLQGQKWDSISSHEFSCPPQIHTSSSHFYKHIGNNVTISCPVTGYPQPVIFWLFESTTHGAELYESRISTYQTPNDSTATTTTTLKATNRTKVPGLSTTEVSIGTSGSYHSLEQLLPNFRYSVSQEMENNHQLISTLTVHSLKPADSQRITCYARNIGGTSTKNFSLVVSTQEPFSSSRSMDFIVTEMFVIVVSISVLLLIVVIFIGVFIAKFKKGPASHVVHSENSRELSGSGGGGGGAHGGHGHNHPYGGGGGSFGCEEDGFGIKQQGLISYTEMSEKILVDANGQAIQYTTTNLPTSGHNGIAHHPQSNGTKGLLMVNTIDMLQGAGGPPPFPSDPNSTDLSSQSTTATSMTLNSCTNGAAAQQLTSSTNGVSPNGSSDTSAGSLPPYYSTTAAGNPYLVDGSQLDPNGEGYTATSTLQRNPSFRQMGGSTAALSMTPDLLASAQPLNGHYYVTDMNGTILSAPSRVNICDAYGQQLPVQYTHHQDSAYPLLNGGPLMDPASELIYGTRIAPTRPLHLSNGLTSSASCHSNLGNFLYPQQQGAPSGGKLTKVKFADQMGIDQPRGSAQQQQQQQHSVDQNRNHGAYAYATLRKPQLRASVSSSLSSSTTSGSTTESQQQQQPLKPLNNYHRGVSSYPEGFTSIIESSVDSGEQVPGSEVRDSGNHTKAKLLARSATVDSLDEAEEDDYYRNLNGKDAEVNGHRQMT